MSDRKASPAKFLKMRLAAVLVVLAVVLAACGSDLVKPLPSPPKIKTRPTTTTIRDFSRASVDPVGGKTTTTGVGLQGGTVTLRGTVTIDGSPIGGANVIVDRFVGDQSKALNLTTDNSGVYSANGLLGGRYRIRASKPPDATLTNPVVVFVNAGENRTQNLALSRFGGGNNLAFSINPSTPYVGDVANVGISITTQGVDSSGVARSTGVPNQSVLLISAGGRAIVSPNPATTNGNGIAKWTIRCDSIDRQGLSVTLPDGTTANVNVAGCQYPPPPTTAAPPTTTKP